MSDHSKAEKIAAAKKKLKQFQSKSKTETASNSTATSCGTESSVNTNGNSDSKANDMASAAAHQINLHFGAIDPAQFESSQLFDQSVPTEQLLDSHVNHPEVPLVATAPINNIMPVVQQTVAPPPIQTFQQFPNYNQTPNAFENVQQVSPVDVSHHEHRIQELANLLQVEKVRNHELSVKVTQQHSTIEEMAQLLDHTRKNVGGVHELQQQVSAHIQTVNILVGEKSDLTAKLHHKDQRISEYESESVELQGRLKASRHRVAELEKDLNTLRQCHQKQDGSKQTLSSEIELLQEENKHFKRLHQEACDESTEIQHQLALKAKENDELKQAIGAKSKDLEMAHVRLEQLTGGDFESNNVSNSEPNQDQRLLDTERQMIELQNMISELTNDRDRTQQQYQTYVQHLTNESTTMTQRIQDLTKANEKLTKREESLVHHVQELEKQIQKQISTQRRLAALKDEEKPQSEEPTKQVSGESGPPNEETTGLREKLDAIEREKSDLNSLLENYNTQKLALQQELLEKDWKLNETKSELERLRAERPDTTNILATIESDKVAASRAMAQNQELRQQLEEMQQAYVQVSNDKLELASQLQSEEFMSRDIRNRFSDVENELKSVKEKLHFKDEEMIRLTHENSQFDSEISKLTKRLGVDSTDSVHQVIDLQIKLSNANKQIKHLKSKLDGENGIADESGTCDHEHSHDEHTHTHDHTHAHEHVHEHEHCHSTTNEHGGASCGHKLTAESLDNSDVVSVTSTINIATNEAMEKLQQRFKRTMSEIADLTEEKHRLEHLVTQLQSETETIGEYIALYQTQRRLLKQREIEKDIQLNRIAADREDMKEKLHQLNELVELLLLQKGFNNAKEIMAQLNVTNNNGNNVPDVADATVNGSDAIDANTSDTQLASEATELNSCQHNHEHGHEHDHAPADSHAHSQPHDANTRETATKIINLLTDIKEKNLQRDYAINENVDHCSCCSGKLEVV